MTIQKNLTTATTFVAALLSLFLVVSTVYAATLSGQLQFGDTGSDVSALQTFLAADSSIYPEGLVTGYFGSLTQSAVMRYQSAHGISPVGRVGPVTLASINGFGTGGSDDVNAPFTTSVGASAGSNSATITWLNNEPVFGAVMYGTNWPFLYATAPSVKSTSGFSSSQAAIVTGLQSRTTYFYVLESTDVAGNLSYTIGNTFTTAQ